MNEIKVTAARSVRHLQKPTKKSVMAVIREEKAYFGKNTGNVVFELWTSRDLVIPLTQKQFVDILDKYDRLDPGKPLSPYYDDYNDGAVITVYKETGLKTRITIEG